MPKGWKYLGEGSFNTAYLSNDGLSVLKIQIGEEATDTPERSVRLWNAINPHIHPPARVECIDERMGWVCPFIEGNQASDSEMSDALIIIYNNTGRIIVDATAPKNFVKTPPPKSRVVCVDVGMALQMEQREETQFRESIRRYSVVSLNTWKELSRKYEPFFKQCEATHPHTVQTVKALVFIKNNRPDIFDVSFLKSKPNLVTELARAYDCQDPKRALENLDKEAKNLRKTLQKTISAGTNILQTQRPHSLPNIKQSCILALERYINSRGSINNEGSKFTPSFMTKLFRNYTSTDQKVKVVRNLMDKINAASTLDEIEEALKDESIKGVFHSKFTSGLETTIAKCNVIVETAKKNPDCIPDEQSDRVRSPKPFK